MLKIMIYYPDRVKTYFGNFVRTEGLVTIFTVTGFYDNIGFYKSLSSPEREYRVSGIPFASIQLTDEEFEKIKGGVVENNT